MLLLDTHILLWLVRGEFLTEESSTAIAAAQERKRLYVSAISAWEIGTADEAAMVPSVLGRCDPGDCFLIATAHVRDFRVVTRDAVLIQFAKGQPSYVSVIRG